MEVLKNKIKAHYFILLISIYFFFHLINLTLLPIFNDESIYLDWAWFNTHVPGHLYDSLLDAKQPLIIWIFGIFENFFTDPLFAGRFVSVVIGSITALGIYEVSKKLLNKNVAIIATLLYSVIPIFVFYNRQALMEAAIACVGVWSFDALLNLLQKPSTRNGIILGVILGLGFFIKSSSLLFVASSFLLILFYLLKDKKMKIIESYAVSLFTIFCVNILLFINPVFWQTLSSNNRYSYSLDELFVFPIGSWTSHLIGFFEIGFVFITPFVFITSLVGVFFMIKNKNKNHHIFLAYFMIALLLEIFLGKWQSQRYIVPFIPFLVIPASYFFDILWKGNILKKGIVITSFLISLTLSTLIIFNPSYYIMQLSKISSYSDVLYVHGQTSGYGIKEAMQYIKDNSSGSQPAIILFPLNIGNPESAVNLYSQREPQLVALHIDRQFFPGIEQYECLSLKYPAFFVTRNDQQVGMDQYFSLEKTFPNPDKNYSIGIYTLKKNCTGNTLSIQDIYQKSINKLLQMKSNY